MAPMASPGEKLTDEERRHLMVLFALSLKRCYFAAFYLCISVQTVSVHIAIPHPPLRGTFSSGEGIFTWFDAAYGSRYVLGRETRPLRWGLILRMEVREIATAAHALVRNDR